MACTNMRAAMEGAGSQITDPNRRKKYPDYTPFDLKEIDSFIGLILVNGIHLKPRLEYWFLSAAESRVYGNDTIRRLFPRKGKILAEFCRFFCLYDPWVSPHSDQSKRTLFKIRLLLDHLLKTFREWWITGLDVSVDEQTLGFQGRSAYKQRIKFKRVGDGFMCNAMCDEGYTYAFYFRCDVIAHSLVTTSVPQVRGSFG